MQNMHAATAAGMASPPPVQQAAAVPAPPPPPPAPASGAQAAAHGGDYGLHHQVYMPEAGPSGSGRKEAKGRLEENAGRLERGVSGMFKKFEKKFG